MILNLSFFRLEKVLKNKYKNEPPFSIWIYEILVMDKIRVVNQVDILISNHWKPKNKVKWPLNWKWHWKGFFNDYNFVFENSSIWTCMWELWACKVTIFIPWLNQEFSILLILSSRSFCHIDAPPPNNHKVYYREQSDDLLPSLGHGVFCELCYLWFIHASFWLQFILMAFFFSLCKLISLWTCHCEFILIPSQSSHAIFLFKIS